MGRVIQEYNKMAEERRAMSNEQIAGYVLEIHSWNGSFWERRSDKCYRADEVGKAEADAQKECDLGMRVNFVTLLHGFSKGGER